MAKTPSAATAKTTQNAAQNAALAAEISSVAAGAATAHRPIPGSFRLLWRAGSLVKERWRVLLGLAFVYMLLNLILVQGLNVTSNLTTVKESLQIFPATTVADNLGDGLSLYTYLLGASGSNIAPTAGAYQLILSLILSLAVIWSLRQIYAGREIRIRDGFYYGMYPFITFFLVLLMVVVHLLPFALGSVLYGIITANGIAVSPFEVMSFLFVFLGLTAVSLYLLCSSLFALYIVTLPEVTPMGALRSARDLVAHRRWTIMRKVVFMPIALLALGAVVLIPIIFIATPLAPWVFTAVASVLMVLGHSYMYTLYRSLL